MSGLRVDTAKAQGLFRKIARRRGMFESGCLDLDRMAQERLDPDLILGVDFGLDGSDLTGRGAAALTPELELP